MENVLPRYEFSKPLRLAVNPSMGLGRSILNRLLLHNLLHHIHVVNTVYSLRDQPQSISNFLLEQK